MMMNLLLLSIFIFLLQSSNGVILQLESTEERCVFDILKKDMLATGYYFVEAKDSSRKTGINIVVTDPSGAVVFAAENAAEGKFAFTAKFEGQYYTCIRNTDLLMHEVELKLKSGVEAKDLSLVAQRDHLMPLAVELLRLEEVAEEIRAELKYLFQIEADMRDVNEETNSRVRFTMIFSLFVILTAGIWQIIYVRRFLASKRAAWKPKI